MNHINGPSMGQPSTVIQDEMLEDLHAELAHWTAVEADAVRDCHARQGGSTGAVPIAAPAAAQPPASALPAPAFGWPPGLVGRIAQALYAGAYSPVPDVAVAAAIALVNGVCGRAYRTYSGKDLAIYIILVAQSGIGKDAIHEGIPELIKLANVPRAETLLRQSDFASGEALHKRLLASPGFLYLQGEFGRKLKRMSNPSDTPMQNFRTTLTNAYGKSFMEGKEYSKEEDSKLGVAWPALSFLGETTPSTFLECLTPDMMEDCVFRPIVTADSEKGVTGDSEVVTGDSDLIVTDLGRRRNHRSRCRNRRSRSNRNDLCGQRGNHLCHGYPRALCAERRDADGADCHAQHQGAVTAQVRLRALA